MTKQEYLYEIWNNNRINTQGKVDCDALVKQIHKDFESRTCDNCKWDNSSKNIRSCSLIGYTRYKDFGCNKFEAKDD